MHLCKNRPQTYPLSFSFDHYNCTKSRKMDVVQYKKGGFDFTINGFLIIVQ